MSDEMGFFTLSQRRRLRRALLGLAAFAVIVLVLKSSFLSSPDTPSIKPDTDASTKPPAKAFVVASMKKDDTAWIQEYLPDWKLIRYMVDNPKAEYTVPQNKGREAMVYLTLVLYPEYLFRVF